MKPVRVFAVALAAVIWTGAASAALAATRLPPGPTVISGFKDGPITIPDTGQNYHSEPVMVSLSLPAGKWIAWAKLFLYYPAASNEESVTCVLGTAGRGGWVGHRTRTDVGYFSLKQTVALSTSASFGSAGGKISLGCSAMQNSVGTVRWIKIMALKVGTLSKVNLATGTRTVLGSGSPMAVIGARNDTVSFEYPDTPKTIARLALPAGKWWVRTSFSYETFAPGWDDHHADCSLLANGNRRDLGVLSSYAGSQMVVMDGIASSSSTQNAEIRCTGNGGPFLNIRITAVKIGTLTTFDASGVAHTQGTGTPKARFRAADASRSVTNANNTLAGSFTIVAGKWLLFAKAQVWGGSIGCQLRTTSDYDRSELAPAGHIATQVVHAASAGETIHLDCIAPNATSIHPATIRGVHLTGFQLGSLKNVAL